MLSKPKAPGALPNKILRVVQTSLRPDTVPASMFAASDTGNTPAGRNLLIRLSTAAPRSRKARGANPRNKQTSLPHPCVVSQAAAPPREIEAQRLI